MLTSYSLGITNKCSVLCTVWYDTVLYCKVKNVSKYSKLDLLLGQNRRSQAETNQLFEVMSAETM